MMETTPNLWMIWGTSVLSNLIVSLVFLFSRISDGMPESEAFVKFLFAWPVGTIFGALACMALFKLIGMR
jgi:hypothetical protein